MASLPTPFPPSNLTTLPSPKTPISISASANPNHPTQRKGTPVSADTKRAWWAPLFRIGRGPEMNGVVDQDETGSDGSDEQRPRSAAYRSGLTAEKARLLRKETRATDTWHDLMYHSSIAARLASPDQ